MAGNQSQRPRHVESSVLPNLLLLDPGPDRDQVLDWLRVLSSPSPNDQLQLALYEVADLEAREAELLARTNSASASIAVLRDEIAATSGRIRVLDSYVEIPGGYQREPTSDNVRLVSQSRAESRFLLQHLQALQIRLSAAEIERGRAQFEIDQDVLCLLLLPLQCLLRLRP
ncbi:hypothetical protein GGTG_09217 [Gaeumannomyces tritici R3-111a-1]|uniref:Uncharacterized protein n=1 Tax=Gaeumannomyces tritici (strain R3-111a-1) TaxID=644352 RepID=J3P6S5_GAET3|nr:hypothetical protein GGTG_09217 [Gaeumannomyces tritici R3-111a-1]EJT72351.1 hypothetical protein GGTG_09217 [Gaeumannomyces tritici R3-111a-1]